MYIQYLKNTYYKSWVDGNNNNNTDLHTHKKRRHSTRQPSKSLSPSIDRSHLHLTDSCILRTRDSVGWVIRSARPVVRSTREWNWKTFCVTYAWCSYVNSQLILGSIPSDDGYFGMTDFSPKESLGREPFRLRMISCAFFSFFSKSSLRRTFSSSSPRCFSNIIRRSSAC